MSRPWMGKAFPRLALCAGLVVFCGAGFAQDNSAVAVNVAGQSTGASAAQPDAAPAPGQRTDSQIEMDVVKALDASDPLKNDLITAATIQSEVTLSGTVANQADRDLAGSIAAGVAGVTKVHNNLKIGDPQQAAQDQNFPIGDSSEQPGVPQGDQKQQASQPQQAPAQAPDTTQDQTQAGQPQSGQETGQQPPPWNPQDAGQPGYPPPPPYSPQSRGSYPGYPGQYPQPYPGQGQPYPGQYPQPYPGQGQPYPGQYPQPYPGQGQPQYPGQYPQQYPNQGQSRQPANQPPQAPVTIPAGTLLRLRTAEPVSSKRATPGTPVQFTVISDVQYGGVLAIPRGAVMHGEVTEIHQAGQLGGSPEFALQLTSLDLGGKTYPVESDLFKVKGPNKAGYTAGNVAGGAVMGAIIGGIAGGGTGAAIGAGVGAGAGTAASAATRGPTAWIPPEALVTFHLASPLTVQPVSEQEAVRLAQGLNPGGPTLYRRNGPYRYGPYGRMYPYRPAPYYYGAYGPGPYPYPPVYYRPYYMIGGFYYWR